MRPILATRLAQAEKEGKARQAFLVNSSHTEGERPEFQHTSDEPNVCSEEERGPLLARIQRIATEARAIRKGTDF